MKNQILLISVQDNLSVMGLRYIHHALLGKGYHSSILYLSHPGCPDDASGDSLRDMVGGINPVFIGISLMSIQYDRACRVSALLKKSFPAVPIVWGGVHPTIDPESCLEFADYCIVGEGEASVLVLTDALANGQGLDRVPNLCYRVSGAIRKNPIAPLIKNLDDLPRLGYISPNSFIQTNDGGIVPLNKNIFRKKARYKGRMYEILTSRGCAFACSYCCNNFFSKLYGTRMVRRRSVGGIIAELEGAISDNPGISMMHIQDDSFMSCDENYLKNFCEAYKDKIKRPLTMHTIPIYVNRDKLTLLKDAGLAWINMGLQSGSDRVLRDLYRRGSLAKDFLYAAHLINEFKIAGKYDVILDNPLETREDKFKTIEVLAETPKPYLLEFYSLTLYPGTEMHERVRARYPERIEDYRKKNYLKYSDVELNRLTALAAYIPGRLLHGIMRRYKKPFFKAAYAVCRVISALYCRPFILLRVFILSNGNSAVRSFINAPMYIEEMFKKKF